MLPHSLKHSKIQSNQNNNTLASWNYTWDNSHALQSDLLRTYLESSNKQEAQAAPYISKVKADPLNMLNKFINSINSQEINL